MDINGVLCCKVPKDTKVDKKLKTFDVEKYKFILRPRYENFLDFCFSNYDVAFFSSTTYKNANFILEKLLTKDQSKSVKFKWFRDRTRFDPNTNNHETIKCLDDIFNNPVVNYKRLYNLNNTILCDDSPTKTRFNNPNNILILEKYTGNVDDTYLSTLSDIIITKFKDLILEQQVPCRSAPQMHRDNKINEQISIFRETFKDISIEGVVLGEKYDGMSYSI